MLTPLAALSVFGQMQAPPLPDPLAPSAVSVCVCVCVSVCVYIHKHREAKKVCVCLYLSESMRLAKHVMKVSFYVVSVSMHG